MDLLSADLVQLSLAFRRVKASEGDVSDDDNNEVNITMFTFDIAFYIMANVASRN